MAKIDTKFNLGDEVLAFEIYNRGAYINRGKVEGISIDETGNDYLVCDMGVFYEEKDLLSVNCTPEELYNKIIEFVKEEE